MRKKDFMLSLRKYNISYQINPLNLQYKIFKSINLTQWLETEHLR
jgi:hypothetical protein